MQKSDSAAGAQELIIQNPRICATLMNFNSSFNVVFAKSIYGGGVQLYFTNTITTVQSMTNSCMLFQAPKSIKNVICRVQGVWGDGDNDIYKRRDNLNRGLVMGITKYFF